MSRENNTALYAGEAIHIYVKDGDNILMELTDLKIKWIGFDIIWAKTSDGKDIEIYLNQDKPENST